mmetsp:Transcript_19338/g.45384  ORF Transcript_19338/g.45384 Transcript_19338/m.45384 type:complete len:230 (+) Transcript_19338:546-1235(+)
MKVGVLRQVHLLVDPIGRVEDPVTAQRHNVQTHADIPRAPVTVTEYVLWDHCKTLQELREAPEDFHYGELAREKNRRRCTWDQNDGQTARVLLALVRLVKYAEDQESDHRGSNVGDFEEDEVCVLAVVNQVKVASYRNEEIEDLCAPGNASTRPVLHQRRQQHSNTEEVKVVANVAEHIPRMARQLRNVGCCSTAEIPEPCRRNGAGGGVRHPKRGAATLICVLKRACA